MKQAWQLRKHERFPGLGELTQENRQWLQELLLAVKAKAAAEKEK